MHDKALQQWKLVIRLTIFAVVAGLLSPAFAQNANAGDSSTSYHFDFNDGKAEGWIFSPASLWSVSNGSLNVEGNGGGEIRYAYYSADFTDATIEVDARQTQGALPEWYPMYGIIVRSDSAAKDFYEFDINSNGDYSIAIFEGGAWFNLVDWTHSEFIKTGADQWNKLKVECFGSTFKFHINGNLVETLTDAAYSSGKAGVVAWDSENPASPVKVEFDNVSILSNFGGDEAYRYCLPYFLANSSNGTGVALRNTSAAQSAQVGAIMYDSDGKISDARNFTIDKKGQTVFTVAQEADEEGWILVNSDRKLAGLSFVGTAANPDHMMGIMLMQGLSNTLYVPHVAQNDRWDTTSFLCNPNDDEIEATIAYLDQSGAELRSYKIKINGNGSAKVELRTILGEAAVESGSVEITATRAIAGFALYSDLKSGNKNYAAICATP